MKINRAFWHACFAGITALSCLVFMAMALPADAASARQIQATSEDSLDTFRTEVKGAQDILNRAKGVLIFPKVYQGGFIVGGEYGEGELLIDNKPVSYYSLVSGSYGFQLGAQRKTIILAFMTDEALTQFQKSSGWTVGVDASVALVTVGAEGQIDAATLNKPILAFVIDQKGLMYKLTLEGTKITRIQK